MKLLYSFSLSLVLLSGCSILFGQVKPVEEKAKKVPFVDISKSHPEWERLEIPSKTKSWSDIPDLAWQSSETAAVISLNSACRKPSDDPREDLKEVTRILLSQWDNLNVENEKAVLVSGLPAWQTLADGQYLGTERKFETVVVKAPSGCIYDLIYLSPVKSFAQERSVFQNFRDSLNLK